MTKTLVRRATPSMAVKAIDLRVLISPLTAEIGNALREREKDEVETAPPSRVSKQPEATRPQLRVTSRYLQPA
jgi:hypothetical protein